MSRRRHRHLRLLLPLLVVLAAAAGSGRAGQEDGPAGGSDPRARVTREAMRHAPKALLQEAPLGPSTFRFSIAAPPGRAGRNLAQMVQYLVCPSARRLLEHGLRSFTLLGVDFRPGVGASLVAEGSPGTVAGGAGAGVPETEWLAAAVEDPKTLLRRPMDARGIVVGCVLSTGAHTERAMAGLPTLYGDAEVPEAGVRLGEGWLRRRLVAELPDLPSIVSLTWRRCRPDAPVEWVVAGKSRAAFVTDEGVVRAEVAFDHRLARAVPVDVEGDGTCEFMDRGGGWDPVSLLDAGGRTLWRYPKGGAGAAADAMAAGDLDGDGRLEFVVGRNGRGGLVALEDDGTQMWSREASNVSSVEIADLDRDGVPEILHSQAVAFFKDGRGIWVRRPDGTPILTVQGWRSFLSFELIPWLPAGRGPFLLGVEDSVLQLRAVDGRGTPLASFIAPRGGFDLVSAVPVLLDAPRRAPFLAAIRVLGATLDRSCLLVFDAGGELRYVEVLPHYREAIAVEPGGDGGGERFRVGVGHRIWEYELAAGSSAEDARRPE